MTKSLTAASALVLLFLSGCAIHQKVSPVADLQTRQICLIENPAVRAGFLESYKRALSAKGYAVRQLPATASIADCPISSTYTANWRWDMALYMSYADIKVYNQGKPAGDAVYDAKGGGANMGKFIDADNKISELVNQLFPGGAGL